MFGLFICGRENDAIPLKSISVRSFLQGYVVGFRSTLTYENNTSNPIEVFFRTPVDDSYAVVGLEACIDGRKIRAEIQEKEKAREMYKEAISSGRTAAFGEEIQGDIFSLVLGNLPPGEKAVLQLTMVGELAVEPDGAVRFVLPTVLKPRYTPPGSTDPLAPNAPTGSGRVHHATGPTDYKFGMVINEAPGIAEVTSPSHELIIENTGQNINVSLAEDKQTDIVILVRPSEAHKPLVIVEPGLSEGENDFQKSAVIMVSFFPQFKGDSSCLQAACEFVFVVDRSGSMDGAYIRDAAQTLLLFLKSIPEGCYFNVIGFGSSYEKLFPESVPYDQKNLETAVKHAENLQANLGGTELFDPLKYVFSHAPLKGLPRQVFVLTDGAVTNTDSVIRLVAQNSSNSRCFSFGIGSGASTTLVKGIAKAGKGTAEFITTGERMQAKVIRSLKKAMQPAVTNTQVSYAVPDDVTVNAVPKSSLPAIFIGERLIVYGILHQNSLPDSAQEGSICLSGDLLGAKIEHNMKFQVPLPVTKDNMLQVSTIHHLAAKKLIKEMESDFIPTWEARTNPELIKISCDSNVICSQTAFIAIDEERKEAVKGSLQSWDILPEEEYGDEDVYGLFDDDVYAQTAFIAIDEERKEAVKGSLQSWDILREEEFGEVEFGDEEFGDEDGYGPFDIPPSYCDQLEYYGCPPPATYGASPADYGCPPPATYGASPATYGASPPTYGASPPTYGASPPTYGDSPPNYGASPPPLLAACEGPPLPPRATYGASPPPPLAACGAPPPRPPRPASAYSSHTGGSNTSNPLSRIINLQLANGAWKLTADLVEVIQKSVAEIKGASPVSCEGEMEAIWATVIVLTYLQLRHSQFEEEWELVAMKSEAWLAKQNLPKDCSKEVLREKALALLS